MKKFEQKKESGNLLNEMDLAKEKFEIIQMKTIELSQHIGFNLNALEKARENYTEIIENKKEYYELGPVISSVFSQFVVINNNLCEIEKNASNNMELAYGISGSLITVCSTSDSLLEAINPQHENNLEIPSFLKENKNRVKSILFKLDPNLAKTFEEIEQIYYGTNADNTRLALNAVRQTFDHFFELLAPDDEVRKSKYWKQKSGKDKEQVTRRERMLYAINTHVINSKKARIFEKEVQVIIDYYNALNCLHKRGNVNISNARNAIFTVKHFIEEFAVSLDEKHLM